MRKIILAGTLALAGCSGVTASNDVASTAVALTGAERLASVYVALPRCPATAPCSDPAVVAQIKAADNAAYAAVKQAEANPSMSGAAAAAVSALLVLIPKQ